MDTFPKEHLIELEGLSPFLKARIVISRAGSGFNSEIDIIQSESGKIYNHVGNLYAMEDSREALDLSVYKLGQYLQSKNS